MRRQIAIFFLIVTLVLSAVFVCLFLPTPAHAQVTSAREAAEKACIASGDCILVSESKLRTAVKEALDAAYRKGLQDACKTEASRKST